MHVQTVNIALSRITHACHIQTINDTIFTLSNDIKKNGLKQPICVDDNNDLIFGERRLHAHEILGKKTIPAWRLSLPDLIQGKYVKAELHHFFLVSERVAISLAIEKLLGKQQGQFNACENFHTFKGRKESFIADLLHFGNYRTYKQAKNIFQHGSHELIEAVDEERISIFAASLLTQFPVDQQKEILTRSKKEITSFITHLRKHKHPTFKHKNTYTEKAS